MMKSLPNKKHHRIKMKRSNDDDALQTHIFQAFHRNKIMQSKLHERQRLYYHDLIRNLRQNNLNKQLNRELLYAWNKENYIRQLRTNLQEYQRKRFGVNDEYYAYQVRNLERLITNQQSVIIPLVEEEYRFNVQNKFHQFLRDHPTPTTSKPSHISPTIDFKRHVLPPIHLQRSKPLMKELTPPTVTDLSSIDVHTIAENNNRSALQASRLAKTLEPLFLTSDTLQKQTGADLIPMRSIRRPKRDPIDLNQTYEFRKRIYQTNKRIHDDQLSQRRRGLKYPR